MAGFKPPIGVANNAKQALEWRAKYPKETADAGTQVGWTRARQLANRENISEDIIGRMVSFFARHEGNETVAPEFRNEPWRDNGYLMHLCWGGDEGKTWSNKIYNQIQNNKSLNSSMSQMQYIHTKLESKSLDEIKGVITLIPCYYGNVDRVNDILEKGACDKSIKNWNDAKRRGDWRDNTIPVLREHKKFDILALNLQEFYDTPTNPVAEFAINNEFKTLQPNETEDIYNKIKGGKMFASIGYYPIKFYVDNNNIRHLQEIKIAEISLTTNPANMKATMIDLKSINLPKYSVDIETSWDGTQAEQRWREYTKSVEMPSTNYKNGFLYFDAENQDLFGSYHLQVVDIVDGEPKIIERAVFAVYQAMRGARGGLTVVPESEMPRLQGAVTELYKKINRVRIAEGMEQLEMPNFKTKSEFDIALEQIKNADGSVASVGLRKMLQSMKKAGKLDMSHNQIEQFVKTACNKPNKLEKTLDNKNLSDNQKIEALVVEPLVHTTDISPDVKTQNFADVINTVAKNFKK